MSAPPTSSPLTNTCGIVGQPEIAVRSWRICGSGSTSTAVTGAPGAAQRLQRAVRVAAHDELRRPLHEERDVRAVDHLLDLVACSSRRSLRLDPQFVDGAVCERRSQRLVDPAVLLDEREPRRATAPRRSPGSGRRRRSGRSRRAPVASGNALSSRLRHGRHSRVDRTEHEAVAGRDARRPRRLRARSRPLRPSRGHPPRLQAARDVDHDEVAVAEDRVDREPHEHHVDRAGRTEEHPFAGLEAANAEQPSHAHERTCREAAMRAHDGAVCLLRGRKFHLIELLSLTLRSDLRTSPCKFHP